MSCLLAYAIAASSGSACAFQEFVIPEDWQREIEQPVNNLAPHVPEMNAIAGDSYEHTQPSDIFNSTDPQAAANEFLQPTTDRTIAEPLEQPSSPFVDSQPYWFGYSSPVRVSVHGGDSYAEPSAFVTLDILKPLRNWQFSDGSEQIKYFDGRLGINLDGGALGNIGMGRKHYSASQNTIWDYGVWYDIDGTGDRIFNQVTGGGQIQGEVMSLRGHYYFPFGDTKIAHGLTGLTGNSAYQGNILALERFRSEEQAYQGYEIDVGFRFPALRDAELRIGYYQFQANNAPEVSGITTLFAIEAAPSMLLAVKGTFDDETDESNVLFTVAYDFYNRRRTEGTSIRRRLSEPVRRNRHIVARRTYINDPVAALNADGTTINVIHVSSAGNSTGAFESPYANLSQAVADATATPDSVILAHADSVFDGQTIALPADTRFLAETESHTITTAQLGDLTLPRATAGTAAPIIRNSPAATPAITLGSTSEVNGLRIESAGGIGVFGDGLTGGTIVNNVTVDGATTGVRLQNSTGTTTFTNLSVSNATEDGIHLNTIAGTPTFTNTVVNSSGRHGVWVADTTGTVTFDSLTVDTTAANGVFVSGATASAEVIFNTDTTISNVGGHGIYLSANSDTTKTTFNGTTTITNTTGDGLRVENLESVANPNQNDVEFLGGLAIAGSGQSGIAVNNNGSNIGITTLALSDWQQSAIAMTNSTGEFHVTDPLSLNNINASAASTILFANNTGTDVSFGDVSILDTARAALGAPTVNLVENHTSVNQIAFNTLSVNAVNGTALFATQTGTNATNLVIGGGNLASVGATALSLSGTATEITLDSVSAQNAAIGINLQNVGQSNAAHRYLRINGNGATRGSGGTITNVDRGVVANASEDITLSFIDIDSRVSGVEFTAIGTDQPENASAIGLRLTDAGGTANWVGIDTVWGTGAHFDDPTTFRDNIITGSGTDQTGIRVSNNQSNPGMSLTVNGNNISLTGANSDGINLSATGLLGGVNDLGDINLTGTVNNIVAATRNNFITTTANGAAINGTIIVNGVSSP